VKILKDQLLSATRELKEQQQLIAEICVVVLLLNEASG